jgi:hypothetical protein
VKLSWPPGAGLTLTAGIAAFVGGLAIPEREVGRSVAAGALILTPAVYLLLVGLHDTRRRLRRRAKWILDRLIKAGEHPPKSERIPCVAGGDRLLLSPAYEPHRMVTWELRQGG